MQPQLAPPLRPGCPWSGWRPPNVDWCEEELCGWVVNPADTWSNLAYVGLGLWMWHMARRDGQRHMLHFGPAGVAVGVGSFAYHMSYTYALQILDFVGMFLFCWSVIAANARRLAWVQGEPGMWAVLAAGVLGFTALVPPLFEAGIPIQGLVALLIGVALGQEIALLRRGGERPAYGPYALGLALLAGGALFSLLDLTRSWCDPTNHWLQGHALWHVLTALALLCFYHFYAGLGSLPGGGSRAA